MAKKKKGVGDAKLSEGKLHIVPIVEEEKPKSPEAIERLEQHPVRFTEDEIRGMAIQLANECGVLEQAETDKKDMMSQFKSRIDTSTAIIAKLSKFINTGYEYRSVKVKIEFHVPHQGDKQITRLDTGEIVGVKPMDAQDFQRDLFAKKQAVESEIPNGAIEHAPEGFVSDEESDDYPENDLDV